MATLVNARRRAPLFNSRGAHHAWPPERQSERMAELDAQTVKEFHEAEAKGELTYLERKINESAGRELSGSERDAAM